MRYLRQKKGSANCGVIAIINALKWAGIPIGQKMIPRICKMINYKNGVRNWQIELALKSFTSVIKTRQMPRPTVGQIEKELKKGNCIVLSYYHKDCGHVTTIVGKHKKTFLMTNYSTIRPTLARITKRSLIKDLKYKKEMIGATYRSVAWVVSKR